MCRGLPHGALIIILFVSLVHFAPFYSALAPLKARITATYELTYAAVGEGVSFLLYPLLGLIADLFFSRYKVIAAGSLMMLAGLVILTIYFSMNAIWHLNYGNIPTVIFLGSAIVAILLLSLGMVEANALQFGLDQLTEASGEQLSRFVYWYFFAMQLGLFVVALFCLLTFVCFTVFLSTNDMIDYSVQYLMAEVVILGSILVFVASLVICAKKHSLNTSRVNGNPLKNIFLVLKYSWKHKSPEYRSAFTYWEEDIPSRIDLGKNKYGGPFTNEEVEDVKTFFRMLTLLLSLFGFHLTGDTFSLSQQLELQQGCPPLPALTIVVLPFVIPTVLVLVLIPFYQTGVIQRMLLFMRLNMMRRMWVGLVCCVLQVFCELVIFRVNIQDWVAKPSSLFHLTGSRPYDYMKPNGLPTMFFCYLLQIDNQTDIHKLGVVHTAHTSVYFWLLIPQFLSGLSMLLVSMTALEFICAQAPQTLQGLLIGLWYAMYSIRYLLVELLDNYPTSISSWYIYHGCKASVILLSLLLFSWAAKSYKSRERDEVVNIQQMIEEIHERYMRLQAKEEDQQRQLIDAGQHSSSYGSV